MFVVWKAFRKTLCILIGFLFSDNPELPYVKCLIPQTYWLPYKVEFFEHMSETSISFWFCVFWLVVFCGIMM